MTTTGSLGPCGFECGLLASSMGLARELGSQTASQAPTRPTESEPASEEDPRCTFEFEEQCPSTLSLGNIIQPSNSVCSHRYINIVTLSLINGHTPFNTH